MNRLSKPNAGPYRETLSGVDDPPLKVGGTRFAERLRLEPIGPDSADDWWLVHNDDEV